jgi:hypothetical protein
MRYNRQEKISPQKAHPMAESTIQPETNEAAATVDPATKFVEKPADLSQQTATSSAASPSPSAPIWTPRFIVLFALVLVTGLSIDSLLTPVIIAHQISLTWASLVHLLPALACLLATIIVTRSWWVRLGAIFASVWVLFIGLNHFLSLYTLVPNSPVPSLLNVIICSALFGAYICLSLDRTPLTRWDTWFFSAALIVSICAVPLAYWITPPANRTLNTIDSDIAALSLALSLLVWWARPSCWKIQPGPTLLFGLLPAIQLLLSFPSIDTNSTNIYLTQVSLLFFLLATMRLLKGQLH